ncbi:hypothetical protein AXF42_Ash000275 [Apostasia shenzhenica]|uniref:Uncharacterized protein n=1 Tax=Apostasia shenzhenica TaxID=1088818 RepID=A0A2I0AFV6_9ASPA|nr:hypothetical protein AXF42_Ash000275 [Apostasia shenzhenica]
MADPNKGEMKEDKPFVPTMEDNLQQGRAVASIDDDNEFKDHEDGTREREEAGSTSGRTSKICHEEAKEASGDID